MSEIKRACPNLSFEIPVGVELNAHFCSKPRRPNSSHSDLGNVLVRSAIRVIFCSLTVRTRPWKLMRSSYQYIEAHLNRKPSKWRLQRSHGWISWHRSRGIKEPTRRRHCQKIGTSRQVLQVVGFWLDS